jgi:hypothetical protein
MYLLIPCVHPEFWHVTKGKSFNTSFRKTENMIGCPESEVDVSLNKPINDPSVARKWAFLELGGAHTSVALQQPISIALPFAFGTTPARSA